MELFYKLLNDDLTAYGGYQWREGGTHRPRGRKAERGELVTAADLNGGWCNDSVLYASRTIADATCYRPHWPYRLFEVWGRPVAEGHDKAGFLQLRLGDELDVAQVFGPNGSQVPAFIRRYEQMTLDEADRLSAAWVAAMDAARDAAWDAAMVAARVAARGAARGAAREAARVAARVAAMDAARVAAWDAARALIVADLIGQHGFTQEYFDLLVGPWVEVMGPLEDLVA